MDLSRHQTETSPARGASDPAAGLHALEGDALAGGAGGAVGAVAARLADVTLSPLDVLLQRMQTSSDFPSLSSAVTRIQRMAASDTESMSSLAGEILKDVALTQKLLRMVNTVHFSSVGAGSISTVSRAVALVGFAGIRNMALSLVLLERMHNQAQAVRLREEFGRALWAAQLAHDLTPGHADAEEAYLAALFHNLGALLAEFYLPEEAVAIRQLRQPAAGAPGLAAEAASRKVLGLGFEALGLGVAKTWGLPEGLRHALRKPTGLPPARALPHGTERHRWLAGLTHDLALALQHPDAEAAGQQVKRLAEQHARALDTTAAHICAATEQTRHTVAQLAAAIGLVVTPGTATHRMLHASTATAAMDAVSHTDPATKAVAPMATPANTEPKLPVPLPPTDDATATMLAAGIQDVMSTLSSDTFQLNAVLRMVLETLLRALNLKRVVFCLRDPRTQQLTGRLGLGADAETVLRRFDIAARAVPGAPIDLFSAVCLKAVDTVIADSSEPAIRKRLPTWYGADIASPSFLLLPLSMKGATFGLIYADTAHTGALVLPENVMAQVRTLRNQAVMAFRQLA